ncbi:hypothetical protein [Nesterenkonia sedimenti]|uniref:hypothetical protein n=1 Tax=Nesterenkonia sedimenti TaxID=1463632 RepID=UPI0014578AE3|nr:hypothetical protein [Nesterenkonia sedimenti]
MVISFVIVALIDQESQIRGFLDDLAGEEWAVAAAIAAGVLLIGAVLLLIWKPPQRNSANSQE